MPIKSNPKIKAGVPCIEGTRITVGIIYLMYKNLGDIKKVHEKFPTVSEDCIKEAIEYAENKLKNK